jgi:uncharacterized protein GlcG (DUF336 family)
MAQNVTNESRKMSQRRSIWLFLPHAKKLAAPPIGKVIGSIGVSGAASNQDEQCAQAGLNALGAQ